MKMYDHPANPLSPRPRLYPGGGDKIKQVMLRMLRDFRFDRHLKNFQRQDRLELLDCFKLKKVQAGQRICTHSTTIGTFCLLIKGKVGIFFPEVGVSDLEPNRIVYCNEQ